MDFIADISANWESYLATIATVLGGLVTAATAIVAVTPSQKDDAFLEKVVAFLERYSIIKKKPTKDE